MDLYSQIRLANPKAMSNRMSGHPDIDAKAGHIGHPHVLSEIGADGVPGQAEVPSNRLANPFAIERPRQVIHNVVRDGTVVLIAGVNRGNKVIVLIQHWLQEVFHPLGGDAPQVGIDDSTSTSNV